MKNYTQICRWKLSKKALGLCHSCRAATCCLHTGQKFFCETHCFIHWKW